MNYKVGNASNGKYDVYETRTTHVIATFNRLCDAKMEARRLNSGAGFDGFTPTFMTKTIKKITSWSEKIGSDI